MNAFEQGKEAFKQGLDSDANPHLVKDIGDNPYIRQESIDWNAGWWTAHDMWVMGAIEDEV